MFPLITFFKDKKNFLGLILNEFSFKNYKQNNNYDRLLFMKIFVLTLWEVLAE